MCTVQGYVHGRARLRPVYTAVSVNVAVYTSGKTAVDGPT